MKILLRLLVPVAAFAAALPAADLPRQFAGATPLEWSVKLADSEIARLGDKHFFGGSNPKARIDYTTAFFGTALVKLADRTGKNAYADYGLKFGTSFVAADGTIHTYKREDYNIDMIPPGKVLLLAWERGDRSPALKSALDTLYGQMQKHPRTSDGGYWHKLRYPNQMWLDGLFMASPFLAHYGKVFEDPAAFDEVAKQILLMDKHGYDPKTGLYYHAWDETRSRPWANKETGQSPNFWGRAVGWYAMALVDSLDFFSPTHPEVEHLNEVLRKVADGIVRWQDPATGLWWQVLDQGPREGNYLEATASTMYVYTLAKGINRGYLPREKYLPALLKGYAGIIRDFIRQNPDNTVDLTRCCEVAGLDYTNSKGQPRDGSFAYYVGEPIRDNDLKGVPAFILAGIELEQLLGAKETVFHARGWGDYATVLARIQAPTFPDRDFPITAYGAQAGADCTDAIHAAIAACTTAGGGRVVVPPGEWLTGAIRLKSNVNLHVSAGATLRWTFDLARYPVVFTRWEGVECMNYSPFIYAHGEENIAITGTGTLDGGATWDTWWGWNKKPRAKASAADLASRGPTAFTDVAAAQQQADRNALIEMGETNVPVEQRVFGPGHYLRPNFIQPYACKNILIEGVTILRSPMWEIHPVLSSNITVRGVKINSHGPNNDGFDPESSRDILVEDTLFDTGDDCIAIKSGRNGDGRRVNVPSENIVVRRCIMKDGHGGVVLGSECTGGIRNVFIEDCEMDSPELDRALRFKNNAVRGGILENVFMRNVKIGRVGEAVLTIDLLYEEGANGTFPPIVRNVQLDNITSTASPRVLFIRGFPGAVIDNIRISNSTFSGVTETEVVTHTGSISFKNVSILPAKPVRGLNSVGSPASARATETKQ
ncbi:Unsaturated rhamnogalacturonyl hydrolase YteR [Lacunisphaera limnophila]|uniref:Unsaturated rhamnogalacturonyl hydrolase YteR n=1 Tax=Lacunisphaera limnophila TaxID=1838286 RepID=A0A1D8AUB1_9BACT|nr:glycoside hydrolase family 88 protein [Lacunisphaera limnophila]AOS44485.1 Unsaturated rhamnogalacturonyl hydrolase YteR [Lacunisphaera limnophila]